MTPNANLAFNELPVFCDEQGWIWEFFEKFLAKNQMVFIKLGSDTNIRQLWSRIQSSNRIVVFWEGKHRLGGAIVEEIIEINPVFDVASKVIVVTANPLREDIVYLSELGIKRIVRIRHKDEDFARAGKELKDHLEKDYSTTKVEAAWQKLQRAIDFIPEEPNSNRLDKLESVVQRLGQVSDKPSARFLDASASLAAARGSFEKAESLWRSAIDLNPNFFRAYHKLAEFYEKRGHFDAALETLHRIHNLNKQRISRLVQFGNVHMRLQDNYKAEHYFQRALAEDKQNSGALNGLAEIRFKDGQLEEARAYLEKTSIAGRFATQLNAMGITLVRAGRFQEALAHYTKAQYVLPQKEKGPRLFFNIGLCYYRWGKPTMALEFLKLALIKEPKYKKAANLLDKIAKKDLGAEIKKTA